MVKTLLGALGLVLGLSACELFDPTAACTGAGGTCKVGPPDPRSCAGTVGPDCYPLAFTPGGHWCCVPCPPGQTQVDGGLACH